MKKVVLVFFLFIISITTLVGTPVNTDEPYTLSGHLNVGYAYKKDLFYRFIFSDVSGDKAADFKDLFENGNIDWITMSKMEDGVLKNDKPLYVHWMVDDMTPISKLTLNIQGPLVNEQNESLDWYASINGTSVIGGKYGYGDINSATIYERDVSEPMVELSDSVQLNLWTEIVKGKTAGKYIGTIVLNVYGEI